MKIYIDNVGIIKDTNIELDNITVITGYNKSGKTTAGKVINAIFSAVNKLEENAEADKYYYIYHGLRNLMVELFSYSIAINGDGLSLSSRLSTRLREWFDNNIKGDFLDLANYCDDAVGILQDIISASEEQIRGMFKENERYLHSGRIITLRQNGDVENAIRTILELKDFINDDPHAMKYADKKILMGLREEFHDQITPVRYRDKIGVIKITMDGKTVFDISIKSNDYTNEDHHYSIINNSEITKVLMIDDADIIDNLPRVIRERGISRVLTNDSIAQSYYRIIQPNSKKKLVAENLITQNSVYQAMDNEEKARKILDKIGVAFDEEIVVKGDKLICSESKLDVRNLAAGSKVFAILHQLLLKGQLNNKTLLIMDEPDNRLHPAWQILLAETLTMLNRELGVKILFTTHSTNMVYALDIAEKETYGGVSRVKVYDTEIQNDDYSVKYIDVSDKLNTVYKKLGEPFIDLRRKALSHEN